MSPRCASCGYKVSYTDQQAARAVANKQRHRARRKRGTLHAYQCPAGNGWHIGHKVGAKR